MRRSLRSVVSAVFILLVLAPAAARAGQVTDGGSSNFFTYTDGAGTQTNDLTVTRSGTSLVFTDTAGLTESSSFCDPPTAGGTRVTCTVAAETFIFLTVTLAGGNDDLDGSGAANVFVVANGGAGQDDLTGGPDQDSLSGDSEVDTLDGGPGFDTLNGGAGADALVGGADGDTLNGDDGADNLQGGDGDDRVKGGADADTVSGGANEANGGCGDTLQIDDVTVDVTISFDGVANDTTGGDTVADDFESAMTGDGNDRLTGNDGFNCFTSGKGDDVLAGLGGDDQLDGGEGTDSLDAGAGDDRLTGDFPSSIAPGEVYIGGDGVDSISLSSSTCDATGSNCTPRNVSVTLDDQPNDGAEGEGDNVRADIEDVTVFGQFLAPPETTGPANVTGSAAYNVITTEGAADTVDPAGGSDSVNTGFGDDTVNARDGFADRIDCEAGADTANVDQLDIVIRCETVNRETVPVGLEDLAPGITFTVATRLDPRAPTVLRADATDDRGIQRVLFMDDDRVVCNDDAAPFECPYQPRGEDVGRDTLIAVAIDTANQAAFVSRAVTVSRFRATRLSIAFRRGRASGTLGLPAALTKALGCRGTVTIRVRRNGRTIATRRMRLSRTCRYSVRIRVRRRATLKASFGGNTYVRARSSRSLRRS